MPSQIWEKQWEEQKSKRKISGKSNPVASKARVSPHTDDYFDSKSGENHFKMCDCETRVLSMHSG